MGIALLFLLVYCSFYNPIEQMFHHDKACMRKMAKQYMLTNHTLLFEVLKAVHEFANFSMWPFFKHAGYLTPG